MSWLTDEEDFVALTIADLFEHVVDVCPDRTALIIGGDRLTYADIEARANAFGHHLSSQGVAAGDHVGLMARNVTDHVVAMLGMFKIRAVPININYRYTASELDYLIDNSGMVALVHERQYAPVLAEALGERRLLGVTVIEDGSTHETTYPSVAWAAALAGQPTARDFAERSPDDLYIVYTGGTTGYPKGVMWRQEDVWRTLGGGIDFATGERIEEFTQSQVAAATTQPLVCLHLGPIMHANGQWGLLLRLFTGQTSVLLPHFDPTEIWQAIDREQVRTISMIGDAMARPLIEELERGGHDGSTLITVTSSSAILSAEVKDRWLAAFPDLNLVDVIGASETGFTGNGKVDAGKPDQGTVVKLGPETAVLDEENRLLDPDTEVGAVGLMARCGSIPLGYLGDPEKTARTFVTVDGIRYAVPGDWVRIEPDRHLTLLGRGSNCINTGGEKVYPEEVEIALKSHPGVFDTLVFSLPDARFGQQVAALVQTRPGLDLDLDEVRTHLRASLSGYKIPRTMFVVERVPRHVTGKADYRAARELAEQRATA
ncbi:acyl-CoA synthetase [Nocardioides daejeonensis]|uniref:acyl-CoA synthetase n=1 Tax=Nocardioides daejeonensis TaxID=1046556 RepID=UPI001EF72BE7|nr:acyl-CoA synthetase [Nocardioides daejeonensis]